MTNTEVRKEYDAYSSTSNYASRLPRHELTQYSNEIARDKRHQKYEQEQEQQQEEQPQQQQPQHRQQSSSDLFHDAEEAEPNDEWNPKLNYETIFDERMATSLSMIGRKTTTRNNGVRPKTRGNILLTVDIKEKDINTRSLRSNDTGGVPVDNIVLPASALDSRSSLLKTRMRSRDEIQYGSKSIPSRCSQDNNTEHFRSQPTSNNSINKSVDGSETENYCTKNTIQQTTGYATPPPIKDLSTPSPISRAVSLPTKSILRTRSRTNLTRSVSFATILHTEKTISVSPECPRRPVRRKTAPRPKLVRTDTPRPRPKLVRADTPRPNRNIQSPSSEEHTNETNESSSSAELMIRVLVLLMDPGSKQYELTSIHFPSRKSDDIILNDRSQPPPPVQLGSLLKLIRKATTHRPLKLQRYGGFCRPTDGREMINTLTVEDNAVREDEILIAIPKGYVASECAELARPILRDVTFNSLVEKLRRKKRMRRRKTAIMAEVQKIERESALEGGWGVGYWVGRGGASLLLLVPVLLLLWTFASMGLQRVGHFYLLNDLGLTKIFNALVDDIETGI